MLIPHCKYLQFIYAVYTAKLLSVADQFTDLFTSAAEGFFS